MGIVTEWQDFIGFLLAHGAHLSRFDVAFDDRAGFIDLDRVESYARAGKVCTHFRKCTTIQSVDLAGHQSKGKTVSFGSRSSATYVRMYDKAAEQQQAEGHWVRVEIEVKDDQAQAVAAEFVQGGIARMAEYLRTVIDFREEGEHSNRSRWPVAEWWAAFLDGASRAPITLSRALRTVAEVRAWVERQVAPSLALLVAVTSSGGLTEINRIIEQGKKRLRLDRYNLIGEVLSYETV
jgi:phage replication initiation protein